MVLGIHVIKRDKHRECNVYPRPAMKGAAPILIINRIDTEYGINYILIL